MDLTGGVPSDLSKPNAAASAPLRAKRQALGLPFSWRRAKALDAQAPQPGFSSGQRAVVSVDALTMGM
jgi:hypothetical protein